MARFSGSQFKGAMRNLRTVKREEAEARNAKTPEDRRKKNRLASK